ncbi:DEAD-box ATP-dependent RNA helicase 42 [Auxenochlorella protothecoides]|uniref:RNA helicase n=1 Tax=Auxenochlorella protothecoides TaxID=3075 RepID=A0A087SKZ8_AUXPR|nr:DEAD-box ATP-dependent RNA helicase 42 [Auxenochlorella protothecoides]KFM26402.1 DEAD-box ATP-dependent RNA helicase 42 [Auxenochlorella protothecoides]
MAPTRELVSQITREVRRFGKPLGVRATAVYGGSGVANQISELKRGSEAVVCTPGRMIDILVTSGGKITNLRRVTYLVLDEADRMFDMGFEPQIARIVNNIRPDRQTVMFSATFPRQVEGLARALLADPVEIQVGGRSVVNADIAQFVELRAEEDRLWRLLELLGEWYERGKLLVFVASQERCDNLFRDLLRHGYPCLSLHGGKDQSDRESTISDFKSDVCNILIATSVAARGLDVKDLVLVVNYDVPNHLEDYVHRVGRTGRAGRAGTAVTFIAPEEEQHAPDVVRALRESGAAVPADLAALAESFEAKRRAGTAKLHGSGFGGSGFKFSSAEDNLVKALRRATAKEYGIVEGDEEEEAAAAEGGDGIREVVKKELDMQSTTELEINDFPQRARWKVTHRDTINDMGELGAAVVIKGTFYPPGAKVAEGDRKIYLHIEGPTEQIVRRAKGEIKRIIEEETERAMRREAPAAGRYSVM